jgi:hypothetical protein
MVSENWDNYVVSGDTSSKKGGGDNWDSYIVSDQKPTAQVTQSAPTADIMAGLAGAGIAAGAGYGAYKGIKKGLDWYNAPKVERNQLVDVVKKMQKDVGVEGRLYQTPKLVNTKIQDLSNVLKQKVSDFDKLAMLDTEKASATILKEYDNWKSQGYSAYKQGLDEIDTQLKSSGVKISAQDFNNNVIKKTLDDAIKAGVPEENLKKLIQMRENNAVAPKGKQFSKMIKFSQAKGFVDEVAKSLPTKAQYKITENWANFIENSAGKDIAPKMKELNSNYRQFAEVRNRLADMIDTSTGELNPTKLNKYLYDYTKGKFDNGVSKMYEFLEKGNKIAKSMEGANLSGKQLLAQRAARDLYMKEATNQINNIKQMLPAIEKQVENLKIAQAKVDKRSLFSGVRLPFIDKPLVSKGLPILGGALQGVDALRASKDIPAYTMEQQSGIPMQKFQEFRKSYQSLKQNKPSEEDINNLIRAGVIG